jgi:hypothetical protein
MLSIPVYPNGLVQKFYKILEGAFSHENGLLKYKKENIENN